MATYGPEIFAARNGKKLTLRTLTGSDAADFLTFRRQIAEESHHTLQYVGQVYSPLETMAERLESGAADRITLNLAVFDGKKLIGHLNLRSEVPGHPWLKHIGQFGMMVFKEYWGQGVGRKLLMVLDAFAEQFKITRIEANVRTSNDRAVKLYQSCGYRIEGTRTNAAFINGKFEDEYFIAKLWPATASVPSKEPR